MYLNISYGVYLWLLDHKLERLLMFVFNKYLSYLLLSTNTYT